MHEPLPLAAIQAAIFDFCRGRRDVCVFSAQAVSQHTRVPRMTADVDLMAEQPASVAEELASQLAAKFPHQLDTRVREVKRDERILGYRVYQRRSAARGGNRHLADVRILDVPRTALAVIDDVQYTGAKLTLAIEDPCDGRAQQPSQASARRGGCPAANRRDPWSRCCGAGAALARAGRPALGAADVRRAARGAAGRSWRRGRVLLNRAQPARDQRRVCLRLHG